MKVLKITFIRSFVWSTIGRGVYASSNTRGPKFKSSRRCIYRTFISCWKTKGTLNRPQEIADSKVLFYSPPLLLIWRQSKAIRYWSDGGVVVIVAPALKIGSEWERGCVSFARLYNVGERKRRNSALIINLFFFFSIQPTPSALNSRKQPTGWKKNKNKSIIIG